QTHRIGTMRVHVADDQVYVRLVAQHNVVEELQAELREFHRPLAHLFDLFTLFFRDALCDPAGNGRTWMHLAPADHLDDSMSILPHLDDLAADFQPDLVDHAEDVAFSDGRIGSHHEIGTAQRVEVGRVVSAVERHVQQFAQQLRRARRIDLIDRIRCLGCRHVMCLGAHAADAICDEWHFLDGTSHYQALEAAQFWNLKIGVGNIPLIIKEYFDLAVSFETGNGVNRDSLGHGGSNPRYWVRDLKQVLSMGYCLS